MLLIRSFQSHMERSTHRRRAAFRQASCVAHWLGWAGVLLTGCGDGDTTDELPKPATPPRIYAGASKACAVIEDTKLRCWGRNDHGRLGFGLPGSAYGDDEFASTVPLLDLGQRITDMSLRTSVACLTLADGSARCWGGGAVGKLGFPWTGWLGDDETLLAGPLLDFGADRVVQIVTGSDHACALLETGDVKCWGSGAAGATGYAWTENLAHESGELPKDLRRVDVGGSVRALAAGSDQTCAILEGGRLRCWGAAGFGLLGLGVDVDSIRDDETPASVDPIQLAGGPVVHVAAQGRLIRLLFDGDVTELEVITKQPTRHSWACVRGRHHDLPALPRCDALGEERQQARRDRGCAHRLGPRSSAATAAEARPNWPARTRLCRVNDTTLTRPWSSRDLGSGTKAGPARDRAERGEVGSLFATRPGQGPLRLPIRTLK
ncbi:Molybdopterin oxidoreductase, iron-sulfur binding subunit [Enhygromyxa salina]|uniref:Molybdopterin oxidoreductase, iron-sulfur binding subunit n=1 Tax=Enhygromyxa salina TaxID=215803 RepID=A0A0C2A5F3_9BACT|nr:Molybdopterin oxidoreductase, iron-sulfur binding subunit [Enhygromyxa salina]